MISYLDGPCADISTSTGISMNKNVTMDAPELVAFDTSTSVSLYDMSSIAFEVALVL
jgi:hypothetical protein